MLHKTVETYYRLELPKDELISMLNDSLGEHGLALIPSKADVTIKIPGGGDYSNCSLDISDKTPIVITWEVKEA